MPPFASETFLEKWRTNVEANEGRPLDFPLSDGVLSISFTKFGPLPNPRNYERMTPAPNFSPTSLNDAVAKLGPAFVYDLYVHPTQVIFTRVTLRSLGIDMQTNCYLAPWVNIRPDDSLARYEWYLAANGKGVGSEGCG